MTNTYQIITNILLNETLEYDVMLWYTGIELLQVTFFFSFSLKSSNLQFFSDHFILKNLSKFFVIFWHNYAGFFN